jgi:hypothetical protein
MFDWRLCFDDPIPIPDGRLLRTLLDAGRYIAELPEAQYELPEWQKATALLLSAVEGPLSSDVCERCADEGCSGERLIGRSSFRSFPPPP